MGVKRMKLMVTEEMDQLFQDFKPYLVIEGWDVYLKKNAPEEIRKKYELYKKMSKENQAEDLI